MFDDCKREMHDLSKEKIELRIENKELQNGIVFCHNQINDLKRRINELQSKISTSHDADLSDRVMELEDYIGKKSPHKWYCGVGWWNQRTVTGKSKERRHD